MKQIIPSDFWDQITTKLENMVPAALRELVPAKFHKWIVPGLVLILILSIILACSFGGNEPVAETVPGTVEVDGLSVHKNPNSDSSMVGQLPVDLEVALLEQKTVNGGEWGRIGKMKLPDGTRTEEGWIDLQYVLLPGEKVEPEITVTEPPTEPPIVESTVIQPDPEKGITAMGTVVTGKLNIRKAAGSQYEAFDAYYEGDRIEIQEIVTVDDTNWGRTGKGWVGMGYVRLDGTVLTGQNTGSEADVDGIVSDGKWKILGYGVVDLGELNVRRGPSMGYDKVRSVMAGTRYAYYQTEGDWVRIEDGWVNTEYFYLEGTKANDAATGKVITDDLNYRTGPNTTFKSNGTYFNGEAVEILAQVHGWGYTPKGWINMAHVQLDDPVYTTGTGTVTTGLNVRQEPDADSQKVDEYKAGEQVVILEVSDTWGRTDKGWINLKYVRFD